MSALANNCQEELKSITGYYNKKPNYYRYVIEEPPTEEPTVVNLILEWLEHSPTWKSLFDILDDGELCQEIKDSLSPTGSYLISNISEWHGM